jgi:hypothetical protein
VDPTTPAYTHLVLDTCCVINLEATGQLREILCSLGVEAIVAEEVYRDELQFGMRHLGFRAAVDEGVVRIAALEPGEQATLLYLARHLRIDDGEAACGALARHRG